MRRYARVPLPAAVALGLLAIVGAFLTSGVPMVAGLPSSTPHVNDGTTIKWEEDGVKDGLFNGQPNICPNKSSSHNHRSDRSFRGFGDRGEPYSASKVWDDRKRNIDTNGLFSCGHGFIDEFGIGPTGPIAVRYKFDPANPPPGTAAEQQAFRDLVDKAFAAWSALQAGPPLITGIEFERVTGAAEVEIRWTNCGDLGTCGLTEAPVVVQFADFQVGVTDGWSLEPVPSNVPNDQNHFLSTALHETGHVVGLGDQDDTNDLMYHTGEEGCPQNVGDPGVGPCFDDLDIDSKEGALDLYSIPVVPVGTIGPLSVDSPPYPPGSFKQWTLVNSAVKKVGGGWLYQYNLQNTGNVAIGPQPAGEPDNYADFYIAEHPTHAGIHHENFNKPDNAFAIPWFQDPNCINPLPPGFVLPAPPHTYCWEFLGDGAAAVPGGWAPNQVLKLGFVDPHPPGRVPWAGSVVGSEETGVFEEEEKLVDVPAVPVGGTTELLVDASDSPASAADASGSSSPPYAAIAGAAAAAALALTVGGWYARRRLLG